MSMIERLAAAFLAMDPPEGDAMDGYRALARKALETLREPTDDMLRDGAAQIASGWAHSHALASWQAMITAALSEGEG